MDIVVKSGVMFMPEEKTPECLSDSEIISLFFDRNEKAIAAVSQKYGGYCNTVIRNILENHQDAEECLNDTWMKAWESIPPEKPRNLGGFLVRLAKNICLNRYALSHAKKRGSGEVSLVIDELSECIADKNDVEKTFEQKLITNTINEFLRSLPPEKRDIFVLRYWYCLPVAELARKMGISRSSAAVSLTRTRRSLTAYLKKKELL